MSESRATGGPRLTAKQKQVMRAQLEVLLQAVPDDRSCHTCDYLRDGYCLQWKADVPSSALGDGCQEWKDEGAPF